MIQLLYMKSRTLNIALPVSLLAKADKVAKSEYRNRSELIREALRKYLQDAEEWEQLLAESRRYARRQGIKSEAQVNRLVREFRHGRK